MYSFTMTLTTSPLLMMTVSCSSVSVLITPCQFSLSGVVISFVMAEYTVLESDGVIGDLFCAELCSGSPKRDFSFYIDVANGSATGNDFLQAYIDLSHLWLNNCSYTSEPLDFYANETSLHFTYDSGNPPDVLCTEVSIIDDSYLENEEYFYLLLNTDDPSVKFKIDHSIVEIVDNDGRTCTNII